MERSDFKQIIKLKSIWRVDRRKGNYRLPSGSYLKDYIYDLVDRELKFERLGIASDGNLYFCVPSEWDDTKKQFTDHHIMIPYGDNEAVSYNDMDCRIDKLVNEIIH